MSRTTADDQLKFLLSCVKHSNAGKIDFVPVARECGIVSKGAAAKRFERLMKANGIHPNSTESHLATPPRTKSKAAIAKSAAAKRRKIEEDEFDSQADDEAGFMMVPPKPEPLSMPAIKDEHRMESFGPAEHGTLQSISSQYTLPSMHTPLAQPALLLDNNLRGASLPFIPEAGYRNMNQPRRGIVIGEHTQVQHELVKAEAFAENDRLVYKHLDSTGYADRTSVHCKQEVDDRIVKIEPTLKSSPDNVLRVARDMGPASLTLNQISSGDYRAITPRSLPSAPQEVVLVPTSEDHSPRNQSEKSKTLQQSIFSLSSLSPSEKATLETESEHPTATGYSVDDCIVIAD